MERYINVLPNEKSAQSSFRLLKKWLVNKLNILELLSATPCFRECQDPHSANCVSATDAYTMKHLFFNKALSVYQKQQLFHNKILNSSRTICFKSR